MLLTITMILHLLLSCTPQASLWTVSLLGFLLYLSILSRLRYPTLSQLALLLLSPIQPYQLWLVTSFLACSLLYTAISTFSRLGSIAISALNTVSLVVREHPSTF